MNKRSGRSFGRPPSGRGPDWRNDRASEHDVALHLRSFAVGLFDRREGHAANWLLIAETLFRAAFSALDEAPTDQRSTKVLLRVHAGAYHRLVGNAPDDTP